MTTTQIIALVLGIVGVVAFVEGIRFYTNPRTKRPELDPPPRRLTKYQGRWWRVR